MLHLYYYKYFLNLIFLIFRYISSLFQNLINNLKTRRDRTIKRLYKRAYRLKKAFPAIDTKEFSEILNKKIEINHKKEKKGE